MAGVAKIDGLTETITKLKELERKVQKTVVRQSTRAGAKVELAAAKAAAPVRSGITQRNVKIRAGGTKGGVYKLSVGVGAADFKGEAFYAAFVLYGHKAGSRKLGASRKTVAANNWLDRSHEQSKDSAAQTIVDGLVEGVEREASK